MNIYISTEITEIFKIVLITLIIIYLIISIILYSTSNKNMRRIILNNNLYLYLYAMHRLLFYIVSYGRWFSYISEYPVWMNSWSMAINLQLFFSLIGINISDILIKIRRERGTGKYG